MSVDRCSATSSCATRAIESTNGETGDAATVVVAGFFDVARFWLSAAAAAACLAIRLSSAFAMLRESAAESVGAMGAVAVAAGAAGDDVGAGACATGVF